MPHKASTARIASYAPIPLDPNAASVHPIVRQSISGARSIPPLHRKQCIYPNLFLWVPFTIQHFGRLWLYGVRKPLATPSATIRSISDRYVEHSVSRSSRPGQSRKKYVYSTAAVASGGATSGDDAIVLSS